jgi:ribonuclease HII
MARGGRADSRLHRTHRFFNRGAMAILVGIDEAGYGPVLGPLVVAATTLEVPDALAETDLWQALAPAVTSGAAGRRPQVTIADSKRVHQGDRRLARLERNVLATCPLPLPLAMEDLAAWLGIPQVHLSCGEPWYAEDFRPLPLESEAADIDALRTVLCEAFDASGMVLRAVSAQLAHPRRLNDMIARTDNKATALWRLAAELVEEAVSAERTQTVCITMDRHGGRMHYRELLLQTFPLAAVETLSESPRESRYRLACDDREVRLTMREKADATSLPVALASMYAKYLREVFMFQFNRWWRHRAAEVAPTAGYWTDYQRWAAEMQPHLASLDLPPELYVRCR